MKCQWISSSFLVLLLGSGCQHSTPKPESLGLRTDQASAPTASPVEPKGPSLGAVTDAQTLVCQSVLKKIYEASGDGSHPLPTVFLSENTTCMAAFFPRKNAIEVERQTYEVCRSFGPDSLNALAIVLSHELSHAFEVERSNSAFRSNFWAYNRQAGSSVEREKSADLRGAFMAHLAGYRIVPIVPRLIQKLYAAYPRQTQSAAYPSETERQHTAKEIQGWVDTLIQVFDAANYLLAIGQSDMAAVCYDHVLQQYKSPEIWNNLGIAYALEALRLPGGGDFAYPFELDWQIRLSRPRGPAPTESQMRQRAAFLQRSSAAFDEALRLSPGYFAARANAWCIGIIRDERIDIQADIDRFAQSLKLSRTELERLALIAALSAAHIGNKEAAEQKFSPLTTSTIPATAALARYNLDVIKNGSDHTKLQPSNAACPIDPMLLELPSVLTLRRMAVAFEGLTLGREEELKLAWEDKAGRKLLKARIGANRFCILQLSPAQHAKRLSPSVAYTGFNGPFGSQLLPCEEQYLQLFKSGKLNACGVFYAYRAAD